MDAEEREHLETLLRKHQANLRYLEERSAQYGLHAPLELHNSIINERNQIKGLEAQLTPQTSPHNEAHLTGPLNEQSYSTGLRDDNLQERNESVPSTLEHRKPINLFISYAHEDTGLRARLDKHLSNLKNQDVITSWYDGEILAGQEWEPTILEHLNTADVILLLISADFLASKHIYTKDMMRAMERHEAGKARVIPVLLKPVDYAGAPFAKLGALPTDSKNRPRPVTKWHNREEAYTKIAEDIRRAVEKL